VGLFSGAMTFANNVSKSYLHGVTERGNSAFILDGNRAINPINAENLFDSLLYGIDERFVNIGKDGAREANTKLLEKVGATKNSENGKWDISYWNRLKSLAYHRNGEIAYARNAGALVAGSYLGLNFLSAATTARHAAGIPYI